MNWIDASSQKPNVGQAVLLFAPTWAQKLHVALWDGSHWRFGGCVNNARDVTHWQPIDPVPKPAAPPPTASDLMKAMQRAIEIVTQHGYSCSVPCSAGKVEIDGRTFDVVVGVEA